MDCLLPLLLLTCCSNNHRRGWHGSDCFDRYDRGCCREDRCFGRDGFCRDCYGRDRCFDRCRFNEGCGCRSDCRFDGLIRELFW